MQYTDENKIVLHLNHDHVHILSVKSDPRQW